MSIVEVLKKNNPIDTENYLKLSANTSQDLRECIKNKVYNILLIHSQSFKARGLKNIVEKGL
jgi:hypothetical protein